MCKSFTSFCLILALIFIIGGCYKQASQHYEQGQITLEDSRYLDAVREFADNVLKYGRDTYGPKHTPLFVDGLNIHTHEPVKWIAPNGDRWILSNLASQQNLFRTLDGLTRITGDPKYKQAAMDAIKYAFENLQTPNGLLHWGGHQAYDAGADETCGHDTHELKEFYPCYELMWEVNPQDTKKFIEAFWSGHVLDWSNLDFDRHCYGMDKVLPKAWDYEYKGGPVFFKGKGGLSFINTGSDLYYAAALLTKFSGNTKPLIWSKRLAHRYVEARNPQTGISPSVFSGEIKPTTFVSPHYGLLNSTIWSNARYFYMRTPGTVISLVTNISLCQLMLGEILGDEGRDFTRYAHEELTAIGKICYRRHDNVYIPTSRNGASLEGYLCASDDPFGPKGSKLLATPAHPFDFWAYAVAYRLTDDAFMWEMARDIARGNKYGDIGISPNEESQLDYDSNVPDPHGLLAFLELYRKTKRRAFMRMAKHIAGKMLADRFHEGFFVGSSQLVFCKFDTVDSLALLHLHALANGQVQTPIPHAWPGTSFFDMAYRNKAEVIDNLIYSQNRSPLPMSFQEAAAIGDMNLVRSLIETGIDIEGREDTNRKTALHHAALNGHKNVVEYLLDNGADVDAKDSWPATPLHYAAEKGHKEISELLIVKGADVNAKTIFGDTPLQYAAHYDRKDTIKLLLEKGATISNIHLASYMGDLAKLDTFIQEGIGINTLDGHGYAPLHYAAQNEHKEAVELLIARGANVNVKIWNGKTLLHIAASQGHKDIVELLIAYGADINAKDNQGMTAILWAVREKHKDIVELLIARGSDINVKDNQGMTVLHYAVRDGHKDVVELLIAKRADINAKDNYGQRPLDFAMILNRKGIFELLLQGGAELSMHTAAYLGDIDKVRSFIEAGASVNGELLPGGTTPLYWAVRKNHKDVAELLIEKGANVQVNFAGWTPLHHAARRGNRDMVELLITKGADVNAKLRNGKTALSLAKEKGHTEIVELLRRHGAKE
jgi:pectate lyase